MKASPQKNYETMYKELVSRINDGSSREQGEPDSSLEQPSDLVNVETTTIYGFQVDVS